MTVNEKLDCLLSLTLCSFKRAQAAETYASYLKMAEDAYDDTKANKFFDIAKESVKVMERMDKEFVRLATWYIDRLKVEHPEIYNQVEPLIG